MDDVRSQVHLCQEVEAELRELCQECRKKFPIIKEYTERAILKIRHHRDAVESNGRGSGALPEFPLDEVLRAILMACETSQLRIVMVSLTCLQRLIHRQVLKDETVAIVINLMKEQATNGDETVQLKVLQTIMATPSHMTLLNELVVEQLMQLLYVLHNSPNASVHHTACAGLRQLAEHLADRAAIHAAEVSRNSSVFLDDIGPVIKRSPAAGLPSVAPSQAPETLVGYLRMFYVFVQDLCVMADYDVSSMSQRYANDAGERMRTGNREGFWLAAVKFPRPLCLELLGACVATHPSIFTSVPECFALLRHNVCATLLKNLRGCFDFAILIRSVHLLQQMFKPAIASAMLPEMQVFLHLMLDLTTAERSPWQRATSLEFLRSICEDPAVLVVLYEQSQSPKPDAKLFLELVNSLSKLIHQVCFSSGMESGALLQSAAAGDGRGSAASASAQKAAGQEGSRSSTQGGANLLDRAGLLSHAVLPNFNLGPGSVQASGSAGESSGAGGTAPRAPSSRVKLLTLMNETEPPTVQPAFLVCLVVDSVFCIVSTIYRLLLNIDEGSGTEQDVANQEALLRAHMSDGPFTGGRITPLSDQLSPSQERCRGMLNDSWASLLSALSLLLHGTSEETGLQQALRCLQSLLYCCSRLSLNQARDACLIQFARYAVPGPAREGETDVSFGAVQGFGSSVSNSSITTLSPKNALCLKGLMHFCYRFGGLLGEPGWTITLRAFLSLERLLQKTPSIPGTDLTVLRQSLDSLFETTSLLPDAALLDVIGALSKNLKSTTDAEDGTIMLNRMVELCNFNLARLFVIWNQVLTTITEVCGFADEKQELRGLAAGALCRILAQALCKGALALSEQPEAAQDELLRHLEVLLKSPHVDTRARICEGLLSILQVSGQELHPTAWGTVIHLVSTASRVELERVGIGFQLPSDVEILKPVTQLAPADTAGAFSSAALQTIFQLLELLVHDFMEYVPLESVETLTASIGAFARYTGLGMSNSLTAVGFLWNVADALARYHCAEASPGGSREPAGCFEELWVHIFMQLRTLASDARPEVRNCAVKSLPTALLSHGPRVGVACYRRCLSDILIKVVSEIQGAARKAASAGPGSKGDGIIVHHSRDTPAKQWDETLVLALEGVRKVLSHFSEEAGVAAFAPLAYTMLVQIQDTIRSLSAETSGSALRALVDLMRIPASSEMFQVDSVSVIDPVLPLPETGTTSVWLLGWNVLWGLVDYCLTRDVTENLVETWVATLTQLRSTHQQCFGPVQHLILVQLSLVLVTQPSWYLPTSSPIASEDAKGGYGHNGHSDDSCKGFLHEASRSCEVATSESAVTDSEVFRFVDASPQALWSLSRRAEGGQKSKYAKAPVAVTSFVTANDSRNCEILSAEAALQSVLQGTSQDEQCVDGVSKSGPTHRTMLHISSARLQHVQGIAFDLLQETQGLSAASLQALFLCQLCALFLDVQRVLTDTNKIALAARTLCLLIVCCRRMLLEQLSKLEESRDSVAEHLSGFFSQSLPRLIQAVALLICCRDRAQLRQCGLWKLAVEALSYIVEDSITALERCPLSSEACGAYWEAVTSALSEVVLEALRVDGSEDAADIGLLSQVIGNLIAQRLLACSQVPLGVAESAVQLLQALVAQKIDPGSANLRHLFALCAAQLPRTATNSEDRKISVAAFTARGLCMPSQGRLIPHREALLGTAGPALIRHVQGLFSAYAKEGDLRRQGATPAQDEAKHCGTEVRFVLSSLKDLRIDQAVVAAAIPAASERAKSACGLAGSQGLAMALLPQLAVLAAVDDGEVRALVRDVLQSLATELELPNGSPPQASRALSLIHI